MKVKWLFVWMVTRTLSSTAQESTVTSTVRDITAASHFPVVDALSSTAHGLTTTPTGSDRTDMTTPLTGLTDIFNNRTMSDNGSSTANEKGKPHPSSSPFALIHSGSVTEATFKNIISVTGYIQLPLSIIALSTNICNVVVFCQKRMKSPTNTILLVLCSSEVLYLFATIILIILSLVYGDNALASRIYLFYGIYFSNYVTVVLRRVGFSYTCLVSAERFIAVTFPLQAKSMRLVKNPGVVCALIMATCFVAHIFSPMKFMIISYLTADNTTTYRIQHTSMYVKDKVHFDNASMASKFIFVYFMLLGCLFFNLLIVISIRRHNKGRQSIKTSQNSEQAQKREMQTTITIMASTVVFVILALPTNTNSIINNFNDDYGIFTREHFLFLLLNRVGEFCELVSNCTNFLFYIALSTAFRETFLQVFVPCSSRGKSGKTNLTRRASEATRSTDVST